MKIDITGKVSRVNKTTLVRNSINNKDKESKEKSFSDFLEKEINKQKIRKHQKGDNY